MFEIFCGVTSLSYVESTYIGHIMSALWIKGKGLISGLAHVETNWGFLFSAEIWTHASMNGKFDASIPVLYVHSISDSLSLETHK